MGRKGVFQPGLCLKARGKQTETLKTAAFTVDVHSVKLQQASQNMRALQKVCGKLELKDNIMLVQKKKKL